MVARFRLEPYRVPRTLPRVQFGAWCSQFCMECRIFHATGNNLMISLSLWWTSDHSLFVLQLWCSDVWAAWCAGKLYHLQPTNKLVPPRYWLEDLLSTQVRPMVADAALWDVILMGCLAKKNGMEKETTNTTLNVELAKVGRTVDSLSCLAQVCCCWDSRGTYSFKAMLKYLQLNLVSTRQVAWLMTSSLLCRCWTSRGSCKWCKHLVEGLTLLPWMNLVGCLLKCPLGSTMNVHVSCALEPIGLGILCNCYQMDWKVCNDCCWVCNDCYCGLVQGLG